MCTRKPWFCARTSVLLWNVVGPRKPNSIALSVALAAGREAGDEDFVTVTAAAAASNNSLHACFKKKPSSPAIRVVQRRREQRPATLSSYAPETSAQSCAVQAASAPGGIRTPDPRLRSARFVARKPA